MGNRRKSVDSSGSSGSEGEYDSGHSGHSGYKHGKSHKDKMVKKEDKKKKKVKDDKYEKKDKGKKEKKDKEDKKDEGKKEDNVPHFTSGGGAHPSHQGGYTSGSSVGGAAQEFYNSFDNASSRDVGSGHHGQEYGAHGGPPSFQAAAGIGAAGHHVPVPSHQGHSSAPSGQGRPPPSGIRIPLDASISDKVPPEHERGPAPCYEPDGRTPIYLGSALFSNSVHPCKIGFHLTPPVRVAYGGSEIEHDGRFDLLPFVPDEMEFVRTSGGRIPPGRRPVEGGYEEGGQKLYHALADLEGVRVPGKTGEHLGGCNVGFRGAGHVIQDGYEILCWK